MKNEKQTAVEWLFDQLPDELRLTKDGFDILQQAKEMERKQRKQSYLQGIANYDPTFKINENNGGKK